MRMSIVVAAMATVLLVPGLSDAKGAKGATPRPNYGGGKHTSSHDGAYKGGQGSSHKGGEYKNPRTDDQYGKHKP